MSCGRECPDAQVRARRSGQDAGVPLSQHLVVGAGIAGVAAARALRAGGLDVRLVDRGRRPGGRMSSRTIDGRPVDLGAAYFTVEDGSRFAAVVADRVERGLARPWTDTFAVAGPEGVRSHTTGPVRYAAPGGLRSLVVDLAEGLDAVPERVVSSVVAGDGSGAVVDGERWASAVLAMPDPQARRLFAADSAIPERLQTADDWDPTIAVVLRFEARVWDEDLHGAFVHDSDVLSFVADDGDRRGDGAPVLVAHTSADCAREHLSDPDGAVGTVVAAVREALGIAADPVSTWAHRWTFARPATTRAEPFLFEDGVGVAGDGWGGRSSVGAAWESGDALGRRIGADG